jgi:anti-sigma factor RsiW
MKRNCFERELLFAYALEMLEAEDELEVWEHVAECAACREVLGEYRQVDSVLDLWQPNEPPLWFNQRVRPAVATPGESILSLWGRVPVGLGWSRWLAPALVAMMILVVSAVIVERRSGLVPNSLTHITGSANEGPAAISSSQGGAPERAEEKTEGTATLDDYDMLANFDVLSELPKPGE